MRFYSLKLHTIQLVFIFLYFIATFGLIVDSYRYPQSFAKLFVIDSSISMLLLIFWALWVKVNDAVRPPQLLYRLNTFVLFPMCLILTVGLSTLDYFTHPGYAKGLTNINHQKIALLMLESGLFALIFARRDWIMKNWRKIVFITPLVLIGLAVIVQSWPGNIFNQFIKEDGPVEYTQVLAIFFSAILFLTAGINFWTKKLIPHFLISIIIGLAFLFVAGEEISWGQRIISLETPKYFIENNSQHEITFHNLKEFDEFTSFAYMCLGFLGSVFWMTKGLIKKYTPTYLLDLIPSKEFFFFYFIVFLYNDYVTNSNLSKEINLSIWAEFVELILYIGIGIQSYLWYSKSNFKKKLS